MSRLVSLAARNVLRNRRRTAITLAAIAFGVTAALAFRSLRNGMLEWLAQDVVRGQTGAFQVHRKGYLDDVEAFPNHLDLPHDPALIARLEGIEGVTGVTARITFAGQISNGLSQTIFIGRGIDPRTETKACPRVGFDIHPGGAPLAEGDRAVALVGDELAYSFGVRSPQPPARLTLSAQSPRGRSNAIDVVVKGLIRAPNGLENKRVVTLPLALAQELLGMEGRVTEYAFAVEDLSRLEEVVARARAELGPQYEVHRWDELRPIYRDMIDRQAIMIGILSVVLFVLVLTGVVNTMLMAVYERVREIGTMLALGVQRGQILKLFLIEAGTIGVLGGIAGTLLGVTLVTVLGQVGLEFTLFGGSQPTVLRPSLDASYPPKVVAFAVLGAVAAALLPAWRASRLDPVQALRAT